MPDKGTELTGIGRRKALKAITAGALPLVAGCSGDGDSTSTTASGGDGGGDSDTETSGGSSSGNVQTGGHLKVSYSTGVNNFNPLSGFYPSLIMGDWMYSKLTTYDHNLNLQPDLAVDWESNDAGDQWTFELREDAYFNHNGQQVIAEDVKASLDTIISEDKAPGATSAAGPVESTEVINDTTVQINTSIPYLSLPLQLAKDKTKILPKNVIENKWDSVATTDYGSGPFRLDDYESGTYYTFQAYDDYYKTDEEGNEMPYVDTLTQRILGDTTARLSALRDEAIDIITKLKINNTETIQDSDSSEIVRKPYGQWFPIVLNTTIEPFDNVKVRQAMKHAIDKEQIVNAAQGYASPSNDTPISPTYPYYADFENPFGTTSNMERAQELLEEAGYADGFELPPLHYAKSVIFEPIAVLFQQKMQQLGIEFELQSISSSRWLSQMWNKDDYWYVSNWGAYLTEDSILMLAAHSDGPWNEMKWSNSDFDAAVEAGRSASTEETKAQKYKEAQRILNNQGAWIIPMYKDRLSAQNNYVENFNVEVTVTRDIVENVYLNR